MVVCECSRNGSKMIEKLILKNFKGFQELQEINLAPLNFIFGENSSGKSAIIHSLALLGQSQSQLELTEDGALNFFGPAIDLGGFKNVIFKHAVKESMTIGIQVKIEQNLDLENNSYKNIFKTIFSSVKIECDFKWDEIRNLTFVNAVRISLIGIKSITFEFDRVANPKFLNLKTGDGATLGLAKDLTEIFDIVRNRNEVVAINYFSGYPSLEDYEKYLTEKRISDIALDIDSVIVNGVLNLDEEIIVTFMYLYFYKIQRQIISGKKYKKGHIIYLIIQLLELASEELSNYTNIYKHIGPVRPNPERIYQHNSEGSAMVKHLLREGDGTVNVLNDLLDSLNIPYEIRVQKIISDYSSAGEYNALSFMDKRTNTEISGKDLGYGISQILPILYQSILIPDKTQKVIMIEQPELHLHPKVQLQLANLFTNVMKTHELNGHPTQFLIETHSENLILRIQNLVKQGELSPDEVQIIYVGVNEDTGSWHKQIKLNPDGQLADEWPGGFFTERIDEWGV